MHIYHKIRAMTTLAKRTQNGAFTDAEATFCQINNAIRQKKKRTSKENHMALPGLTTPKQTGQLTFSRKDTVDTVHNS